MATDEFGKARDAVIARCSNEIGPMKKEGIHMSEVGDRGRLNPTETKQCISIGIHMYNRAAKIEPQITDNVVDAVTSTGAKMYGLEHRLKRPASIAAKIGADAKENGKTFEEAAKGLKDVIRYTAVSDDRDYTNNYYNIKSNLEAKGYRETKCKNYFNSYKLGYVKHKAVQSNFTDRNGNTFELQFHTPSSQAAKELKLPIYNERRKSGISLKRARQLERKMTNLAEKVSDPLGVYDIEEHKS